MKKNYFLLFFLFSIITISMISFSTSSHGGSELQVDVEESTRNIVIRNSQGEKIRKICFDCHPTNDLRLRPFKGETIFLDEDREIEMTLSYPAWKTDLLSISYGLERYNHENVEDCKAKTIEASFKDISFTGTLHHHGVHLFWNQEEAPHIPIEALFLLRGIQERALQEGAQVIYVTFPLTKIPYRNFLQEENFLMMGEKVDCLTGKIMQYYYKKFDVSSFKDPRVVLDSNISIEFKDLEEEEEKIESPLFGIFIRNLQDGSVEGGAFGSLNPQAAIPHSHIDVLWIDEKHRGHGIGKMILSKTEVFSQENKAPIIELETADFQAPKFYKKMGYHQDVIYPGVLKQQNGSLSNVYFYHKKL